MSGRSEILQTRLSVSAVQIIERLKIRAKNLDKLLDEEIEIDNRLIPIESQSGNSRSDFMGLENLLLGKRFDISQERRKQDVECWRDLVNVMRDFLKTWEDLSGLEAKQRFMNSIPKVDAVENYSASPITYHNDTKQNDPYYRH